LREEKCRTKHGNVFQEHRHLDEMRPVLEQLDRLAGIWYEEDLRAGRVPAEVQVES
jgi:hypothetical protein